MADVKEKPHQLIASDRVVPIRISTFERSGHRFASDASSSVKPVLHRSHRKCTDKGTAFAVTGSLLTVYE
jgi:hypothetical protein